MTRFTAYLVNGFRPLRRQLGALRRRTRIWRWPVGVVAADRRLLAAERPFLGRDVAVLGPSLAVRQALPDVRLDVIGTDPFDLTVTVLSDGLGPGSLPVGRWSSLVLVDPPVDQRSLLLDAAATACRVDGVVAILAGRGDAEWTSDRVRGRRQLAKLAAS